MKKKKNIIIAAMLLILVLPVQAQVFYLEDDEGPDRNVLGGNGTLSNVIVHGSTNDQANFVPIGSGVMLLAALGGAYLVKREKHIK